MKTAPMIELVKDNFAEFAFFRDGTMYYNIVKPTGEKVAFFPIDVTSKEEIGNACFNTKDKAITLMRYIRRAIKDETIFIM